jgi:pimeloyl-ACP methyl ester carboxylesterase
MIKYFVARGETLSLTPITRAGLRGSFIELSDGITHYELSGPENGELVLLLPGITVPLFYWDKFAARLHASGLRTLAYSGYGRGYSDRVVATYDRSLFLRQTRELIGRLALPQVSHLVATSMGALSAMALIQEDWFSTRTMTLAGPAGLEAKLPLMARLAQKGGGLMEMFARYMGHKGVTAHLDRNVRSADHVRELKELLSGPLNYEGSIYALVSTLAAFPLINQQDLYRRAATVGVPILLLWGDEDQVTPADALKTAQTLLNPSRCHVIRECGHMAPFERPDEVAALFVNFISSRRNARVSSAPTTAG